MSNWINEVIWSYKTIYIGGKAYLQMSYYDSERKKWVEWKKIRLDD